MDQYMLREHGLTLAQYTQMQRQESMETINACLSRLRLKQSLQCLEKEVLGVKKGGVTEIMVLETVEKKVCKFR